MQIVLYYFPLIVLVALAISDLIVGVANDAVNFTNSAVGSHVAPRWAIMIVASVGIVIGTIYSSGMLEIARKGVFYPQYFTFDGVIIIFLAVMFSDVILLDLFNTYGLPTSTSVSFVFELLGGATAIGLTMLWQKDADFAQLAQYINSDRALLMIFSIFISVILALSIGALVQFATRLVFTFRIKRHHRISGSIWSALAMSFIFYYILIKGLKGSMLLSAKQMDWLQNHVGLFLLTFFVVCSVIFTLLSFYSKINPLKIFVLTGTFALALSFAANDLVNFIGVPFAGFLSYQLTGFDMNTGSNFMASLNQQLPAPVYVLLAAGIIMTLTLWFSQKARYVTKTEVELARHAKGEERFTSSPIALYLVELTIALFQRINKLLPHFIRKWIKKRYRPKKHYKHTPKDLSPAFDLVRASVNLMVASSLISLGTSLKLPLSTTYVTFMVAMGSSIADNAWDRQNASYRVNGVLIVVGGWFLTGLLAFTGAFLFAMFLHYVGEIAIFVLMIIAFTSILRTRKVFRGQHAEK
ncbi:inorganic phosphate transporter [candidate division KSB1 bacterium]|nr:inorganic phosphate transporter [candidate division KSB1 bacterium]